MFNLLNRINLAPDPDQWAAVARQRGCSESVQCTPSAGLASEGHIGDFNALRDRAREAFNMQLAAKIIF